VYWFWAHNLKQVKKKALNATLKDDSEEEKTPSKDSKLVAFVALHDDPNESYYSESSDNDPLEKVYKKFYLKFMKLREVNQKNVLDLNLLKIEKRTLLEKIRGLEEKSDRDTVAVREIH
jgi:hypothetical protein